MLASALILFREVFEAALIVGIVLAATKGVTARGRWVLYGIGGGLAGSALVAVFAQNIGEAARGMGQEYFNAGILFLAVGMLGWHNVWMSRHGREISQQMGAVGKAVSLGARPLYALAIVVGLATLREGSEVVLFLYGISLSGGAASEMLLGSLLGLGGGVVVGTALYFGLLRIPTKHLFTVTSWMILLLAAGLASQGIHYLVQAGVLPSLGQAIWDSSHLLSERSMMGQLLHTLIGYSARPDGIQLVAYVATLLVIGGLMRLYGASVNPKSGGLKPGGVKHTVLALLGTGLLLAASPAHATQKVYGPHVEEGEAEIEYRGHLDVDDDSSKNKKHKHKLDLGYGITDFWFAEIIFEYERKPGGRMNFEAVELESVFQLTPQGAYYADLGFYAEYSFADDAGKPDKVKLGPIFQKAFGRTVMTANTFFRKEIGPHQAKEVEFEYAWQLKYRYMPQFEFGIEAFGKPGELNGFKTVSNQEHQLGPVIYGEFPLTNMSGFKYETGLLFGLTDGTSDMSVKWLVEYEFRF